MGQMIKKPDVNPILVAALNVLTFGLAGYLMIGQTKKAVVTFISTMLTAWMCVGLAFPFIAAYDAYMLSEKLKSGQAIGEQESALEWLNAVFK